MSRYKYTKLKNLGPANGFIIHTPDNRNLKDLHPQLIVRELNRLNNRIKRLESLATDQRNRAEKWYIEEREGGDSVSIATTRAYFLAYTEIVREIRKAKEAKP